jgi:hypothetical protein
MMRTRAVCAYREFPRGNPPFAGHVESRVRPKGPYVLPLGATGRDASTLGARRADVKAVTVRFAVPREHRYGSHVRF